jgi:hypothetical protein
LYFWTCTPFVVPISGDALMPAAPPRPGQHPFHLLRRGQHQPPEEPVIRSNRIFPVFNNTLHQRVSRLVREALSFSKPLAKPIGALTLFICHYKLTRAVA